MLAERMNGIFQILDQINYALLHHYEEVLWVSSVENELLDNSLVITAAVDNCPLVEETNQSRNSLVQIRLFKISEKLSIEYFYSLIDHLFNNLNLTDRPSFNS